MAADRVKPRVVSGMRPTGKIHLGHLVGALRKWAELQTDYDCMYFVADWHALTSEYEDTTELTNYAFDNVADWIAAGLDPERSTFFVQSLVPEHAELYLLLSMVVPIPWLERVPTYKEQIDQLSDRDLSTIGFLGYPLLQGADVVIYGDAAVDALIARPDEVLISVTTLEDASPGRVDILVELESGLAAWMPGALEIFESDSGRSAEAFLEENPDALDADERSEAASDCP